MKNNDRFIPFLLLAGDFFALLLFVYIGQRDHELVDPVNPVAGVLLTTAEFLLPWLVVGLLLGAFPRGGAWRGRDLIGRSLNTWLVAAPLGLLLRAYILNRAVIPTLFMVVALALGGAFVLGWRLAFILLWKRVHRRLLRQRS